MQCFGTRRYPVQLDNFEKPSVSPGVKFTGMNNMDLLQTSYCMSST
jgi:hypothetical protein